MTKTTMTVNPVESSTEKVSLWGQLLTTGVRTRSVDSPSTSPFSVETTMAPEDFIKTKGEDMTDLELQVKALMLIAQTLQCGNETMMLSVKELRGIREELIKIQEAVIDTARGSAHVSR